jgi:hypothetical protein
MHTGSRDRTLAVVYAATIFVSAFLLFQVQPLISKYILPWFGGTPAVWTTCMLFFQVLLFAGYAYAHASGEWLRPRHQAALHLAILLAAAGLLLAMGLLPDEAWKPTDTYHPVRHILLLLAVTIGLPYFILATTGPLIQAWFARSFPGRAPYRLYALSNVGSLLALLSYPFWFERVFDLPQQALIWTAAFIAFVMLCGYAALRLRQTDAEDADSTRGATGSASASQMGATGSASASHDLTDTGKASGTQKDSSVGSEPAVAPNFSQCVGWLAMPMLASVALLATTNYVCADIAVVPFLWVVPLALYLVTFIIAFDHPRWYWRIPTALFTLLLIYGVGIIRSNGLTSINLYTGAGIAGDVIKFVHEPIARQFAEEGTAAEPLWLEVDFLRFLAVNFAALFGICMLCHGELFRMRPHPRYLTLYYLMIAAGGALGGVAVSLVAPQVFDTYFEWELSIVLGCLLAVGLLLRTIVDFGFSDSPWSVTKRVAVLAPLTLLVVLPSSVAVMDLVKFLQPSNLDVIHSVRNFFGALTVREETDHADRHIVKLRHGAITHGSQFTDSDLREQPITYYGRTTGVAHTVRYYREVQPPGGMRLGVVGLGTGTMAAFVGDGDYISFYEIDPAVIGITENGRWFTYLQDAKRRGATYEIKLGDARLSLARELAESKTQRYHALVLDAFSGDAIPAHLLTAEAFEIYLQHLATGEGGNHAGALVVHISNRYVDLEPIVRAAAEKFKLLSAHISNDSDSDENISSSTWIILSNNQELMDTLSPVASVPDTAKRPPVLWTDHRSNLFDVLKPKKKEEEE